MGEPKVVIAHDYLTQRGGAERVVLAMLEAFPGARVVTSIYNPDTTFDEFRSVDVQASWLSRADAFRADPRRAFPLLAATWSRTTVEADVVVCSSSGWAHGVRTSAPKIVYCHNPARWLYQSDDYCGGTGIAARMSINSLGRSLRAWDYRAAKSATKYLANSSAVAARIYETYGIDAPIVHPPVVTSGGPLEPVHGVEPGFLLTVGRSRGYKNIDQIVAATDLLPNERLVVVGEPGFPVRSDRIKCFSDLSDGQMRWLYANAHALIACAHEDFGLTPIEAFSVGTPVLALRAGGYLDTMLPGVTGEFVPAPDPVSIAAGVRRLRQQSYSKAAIKQHCEKYGLRRFVARMRDEVAAEQIFAEMVA